MKPAGEGSPSASSPGGDREPDWPHLFRAFADQKTAEAASASIAPLHTTETGSAAVAAHGVGNAWSRAHYDGPFTLVPPPDPYPAVSLVFVQSLDGNTGARSPADLGGGPTDAHLIYEGLSRVAADAVLAGAATAAGRDVLFSLWHPELVALRADLGLPRHPKQIVVSNDGHLDVAGTLLFNVPEIPVVVIAGEGCRRQCAALFAHRPWLSVIHLDAEGWPGALRRLRERHGVSRISAVGGRTTSSGLIDAGVVQDLCLTTTSRQGGEPHSPFYVGDHPPKLSLIVRKATRDGPDAIVFEHWSVS